MEGVYTFPNNEKGRALRAQLAASLASPEAGVVTVVLSEETNVYEGFPVTTLLLTAGKRTGEGAIAANVKKLKARKEYEERKAARKENPQAD